MTGKGWDCHASAVFVSLLFLWGEKGWRSGERTFDQGTHPGVDAICGLSLLLVTLSLAPRGFSPGTPISPLIPNSGIVDEEQLWGWATSTSTSGRPDYDRTSHFDNQMAFFHGFFL